MTNILSRIIDYSCQPNDPSPPDILSLKRVGILKVMILYLSGTIAHRRELHR